MIRASDHNRRVFLQDAQKGHPARPQQVKPEAYSLGYVDGLNEARTLLADFFSILLVGFGALDRS
jgi:hypothetical protein